MTRWLSLVAPVAILVVAVVVMRPGEEGTDDTEGPPAETVEVPVGEALLVVSISPESRVKASAGAAVPALRQGAWVEFGVEIENAALMTAPIFVESAQSMTTDGDDARDRWLKIELDPPGQLTGELFERRVLRLWSRDPGKRAAVLNVNAGQGTQDLGFRSDVLITFDVAPAG